MTIDAAALEAMLARRRLSALGRWTAPGVPEASRPGSREDGATDRKPGEPRPVRFDAEGVR